MECASITLSQEDRRMFTSGFQNNATCACDCSVAYGAHFQGGLICDGLDLGYHATGSILPTMNGFPECQRIPDWSQMNMCDAVQDAPSAGSSISFSLNTDMPSGSSDGSWTPLTTHSDILPEIGASGNIVAQTGSELGCTKCKCTNCLEVTQGFQRTAQLIPYLTVEEDAEVSWHGPKSQHVLPSAASANHTDCPLPTITGETEERAIAQRDTQARDLQYGIPYAFFPPAEVYCQCSETFFGGPIVAPNDVGVTSLIGFPAQGLPNGLHASVFFNQQHSLSSTHPTAAEIWHPEVTFQANAATPQAVYAVNEACQGIDSSTVVHPHYSQNSTGAVIVTHEDTSESQVVSIKVVHQQQPRQMRKKARRGLEYRQARQEKDFQATSASRPSVKDEFLVRWKRAGMSYKQIRDRGHFTEAESTLRGRFRNLTKEKQSRVRRPRWEVKDVSLLKEAVALLGPKSESNKDILNAPSGCGGLPRKVPWKKIAEYIATHGGSYQFGIATCRKKWDEVKGF